MKDMIKDKIKRSNPHGYPEPEFVDFESLPNAFAAVWRFPDLGAMSVPVAFPAGEDDPGVARAYADGAIRAAVIAYKEKTE